MFTHPALDWVDRRFGEYDLVYLDPLICDPCLRQHSIIPRRSSDPEGKVISRFFDDIAKVLNIKKGDEVPRVFLSEQGPGGRLKRDRGLQKRVLEVINRCLAGLTTRHFLRVESLDPSLLGAIADRPGKDSFLVVDAMFASQTAASPDIQDVHQIASQPQGHSLRGSSCMLTDMPNPLLTWHDSVLPLIAEERAIFNWSDQLSYLFSDSVGWYPYMRAIGLYGTEPSARGFLNVLALLVRAQPSLNEVLVHGKREEERCSLPGTLRYVKGRVLDPEIEKYKNLEGKAAIQDRTAAATGGVAATADNVTTGTSPVANSSQGSGNRGVPDPSSGASESPQAAPQVVMMGGEHPAGDAPTAGATAGAAEASADREGAATGRAIVDISPEYYNDELVLAPVHLFKLCCNLSHATAQGLQRREPHAYRVLNEYLDRLSELKKLLQNLKIATQITEVPARAEDFLPQLSEQRTAALLPIRRSGP